MSCELHDPVFDNSLDLEVAAKKGIFPPAIVLFPNYLEGNMGTTAEIQVYALEVNNVGMAQIPVYYDPGKLAVESVVQGSLFQGGNVLNRIQPVRRSLILVRKVFCLIPIQRRLY